MRKLNHISLTFAISLWIFYYFFNFKIIQTILLSTLTAFFSSLPDIDIKIIKKIKKLERKTLFLICPLTYFLKVIFKHRNITHSIWFFGIFFYISEFFLKNKYLILFTKTIYLAIILHIIQDSFTKTGIKLFYPIKFKLKLANFSTNKNSHFLFFQILAYIICLIFIFFILY